MSPVWPVDRYPPFPRPSPAAPTSSTHLSQGSEDRPLPLAVYNTKNATLREIIVTPSRKWPGEGMLGLTIRFDTFAHSDESVIHVLEVEHDSPAEIAGLQPDSDYLLGTAEKIFQDTDVLFLELQTHLERPVEFFVYNAQQDDVRIVVLMPTEEWGGEGILGASVGHGYLHMLPAAACQTTGHSAESIGNRAANSAFGFNTSGAMDMAAHGAAPAGAAGAAVAVVAVQDTSVATVPAAPTDHSTAATHSPSLVPPV